MNNNPTQVVIYRLPNKRARLRWFTFLVLMTLSVLYLGKAKAETVTLQAITDFAVLDAGDVPFYRDTTNQRNVLAINAGIEEYRSRYAMATTEFTGSAGFYDLELTTLGELDGDCVYQVVINGDVVGTAVNSVASVDYEVQQHRFEDIYVPAGATLGVTAVAVSNGLIPENDAFAFARGRWRTLVLTSDAGGTDFTPVVDLTLDARYTQPDSDQDSNQGSNAITVELEVSNASSTPAAFTATAPLASVVLPEGLVLGASDDCSAFGYRVYCDLADLANGATETVSFIVEPSAAGDYDVAASVIADERELNTDNNLASLSLSASYDPTFDPNLGAALAGSTGGGSLSWYFLLLVSAVTACRRRLSRISGIH